MKESESSGSGTGLTATQEFLRQLWEEHVRYEFAAHNTEDTLATMVEDAYVNHIPVLTGGMGQDELREFYSKRFIPRMPPDTEMIPASQGEAVKPLVPSQVEATALIEGDDAREAFVVIGSMGNRCDALPAPQRPSSPARAAARG